MNRNDAGNLEAEVELLNLVEGWRVRIAENIVLRNCDISACDLNKIVWKIIVRIIFLRILEDKGIGNLKLRATKNTIPTICNTAIANQVSEILKPLEYIDDEILSTIIASLYSPDCSLEFSMFPTDILGNIYEKFLRKTISFTQDCECSCRKIMVEEKSGVRKAGGVFYTPQYIVKFIVSKTVGKIIAGKTPDEISQLRIVDPACGSGLMLMGAYQFILDYHLGYYTTDKNLKSVIKRKKIYKSGNKKCKLTIDEKQRILLNNIFGVDIDPQAVEVTKFSLYLKLLENENSETCGQLSAVSKSTLLANIENNIKTGNSLIGTDFYNQVTSNLNSQSRKQDLSGLSGDEQFCVNCFDWDKEFPEVFANGGFDAVIGNPPYYNMQSFGAGNEKATYIQNKYSEIWQDKSDILFYFIYKALQISKGEIGYITSNAFLFSDKASKLRNVILSDGRFAQVVNFERYKVFSDASIASGIFIFNGQHKNNTIKATIFKNKTATTENIIDFINNDKNYFSVTLNRNKVFALTDSQTSKLNQKIDGNHPLLRDLFCIGRGMETGANEVFLFHNYPSQFPKQFIKKRISGENIYSSYFKIPETEHANVALGNGCPMAKLIAHIGYGVTRYVAKGKMDFLLYFEDVERFEDLPISIQNHLTANAEKLKNRADKKRRHAAKWWNYTFPLHKEQYLKTKICCSYRNRDNEFILDEDCNSLCLSNMTVIFATHAKLSPKYLLAILNSNLFKWRYQYLAKQTGNGIFEYMPNGIGKFPIPLLNLSKKSDKITHDKIVILVDNMLQLQAKQTKSNSPTQKIINNQINEAVYNLYGLNNDEIKIIFSYTARKII
ncbi:MAG: N-6 DNA methylase [Planctomycetaceae bacterium]|jgi:adenine-specific DNA-methyltransferase|nr:N-6 DNA methylase [Planctomycetaceae bacterium]